MENLLNEQIALPELLAPPTEFIDAIPYSDPTSHSSSPSQGSGVSTKGQPSTLSFTPLDIDALGLTDFDIQTHLDSLSETPTLINDVLMAQSASITDADLRVPTPPIVSKKRPISEVVINHSPREMYIKAKHK